MNNRRFCSSCRLKKCFSSGMKIELIRCSRKTNVQRKKVAIKSSNSVSLVKIPRLNFLGEDQSKLNVEQRTHLSNLIHCFDQSNQISFAEQYLKEQMSLLPKFRFKCSSVKMFIENVMRNVQFMFEKNRDVLNISLNDRKMLLHNTIEYTTSFGCVFLFRQVELFRIPSFLQSTITLFQPSSVDFARRVIDQFDPDITLLKIIFSIISLFTSNYTIYENTPLSYLENGKTVIQLQDIYIDLVWRYLLFKRGHHQAVLYFSNLIRCLFLLHHSVLQAREVNQFQQIMDHVVQETEQKLTINQ